MDFLKKDDPELAELVLKEEIRIDQYIFTILQASDTRIEKVKMQVVKE